MRGQEAPAVGKTAESLLLACGGGGWERRRRKGSLESAILKEEYLN